MVDDITDDDSGESRRDRSAALSRRAVLGTAAGGLAGSALLGAASAAAESGVESANGGEAAGGNDRVESLIERMTLQEKIDAVHGDYAYEYAVGYIPPNERLGIPALKMTDGPVGVREPQHLPENEATAFPATIAAASTWDPDLVAREGTVTARETKAKDLDVLLAPAINLTRVPVNGRTFEYFSEDPHLSARMSVAYVEGVQSEGVIATAKHYVANNQERNRGGPEDPDIAVSANVGERALRELYLPSFKAAVQEAEVGSIMAAYNRVNGTYVTENRRLLTEILKEEWGFEGYVVSDWGATHSAAAAANAGLDVDMPGDGVNWAETYFDEKLREAVESGAVSEDTLDEMVRRVLGQMERFGLLDGKKRGGPGALDAPEHRRLSREIAEKGAVLLRNEDEALPIDAGEVDSIAVLGRGAQRATVGGGGSSDVEPFYTVNPREAIEERAGDDVTVEFESQGSDAFALAEESDVALVFASGSSTEGEDRDDLVLDNDQNEFISKVAEANDRTIVVLRTGGPVVMPWAEEVDGIVEMWYPGQEDGNATASVLFGDVNPSGKLPVTFGRSFEDYPVGDETRYPGTDDVAEYSEGVFVGYRHFDERDVEPLFPFGYGLSYTSFAYGDANVAPDTARCGDRVTVTASVENTGDRAGAEVVQLYVRDAEASVDRPPKELKAFERVELEAGQRETVRFELDRDAFAFYSEAEGEWVVEPGEFEVLIGRSSRDIETAASLRLTER